MREPGRVGAVSVPTRFETEWIAQCRMGCGTFGNGGGNRCPRGRYGTHDRLEPSALQVKLKQSLDGASNTENRVGHGKTEGNKSVPFFVAFFVLELGKLRVADDACLVQLLRQCWTESDDRC